MQVPESFVLLLLVAVLGSAAVSCAAAPADPPQKAQAAAAAREWVLSLPEAVKEWLKTVQYDPAKPGEPWGLFTFSKDSKIPYSLPSTTIGWGCAELCGGIEKLPGYHPKAKQEMAAWVQKLQDPKTHQFIDPLIESCVPDINDPNVRYTFREAVSKYAISLLRMCDSKPLHPWVWGSDEEGKFDPERYLKFIKSGDWDNAPWGIGSHAAGQTVQVFELVNQGRDDLIPTLIEGTEFILSKQNPRTGMWGTDKAGLDQQIGGAIKVIGRFQWYIGLISPHMDKLAESILTNHRNGAFYAAEVSPCVPRNVSEMAYACIEAGDYHHDALRRVLVELFDELKRFRTDDGGFGETRGGTAAVGWCQAVVAEKTAKPRGDLVGTQLVVDTAMRIYDHLGWTGGPWPQAKYWRTAIEEAGYNYAIVCDSAGKVRVLPRGK